MKNNFRTRKSADQVLEDTFMSRYEAPGKIRLKTVTVYLELSSLVICYLNFSCYAPLNS